MLKKNTGDDITLNTVNEIETLISEDKYNNDSIEGFKKQYSQEIEKLEEALKIIYI